MDRIFVSSHLHNFISLIIHISFVGELAPKLRKPGTLVLLTIFVLLLVCSSLQFATLDEIPMVGNYSEIVEFSNSGTYIAYPEFGDRIGITNLETGEAVGYTDEYARITRPFQEIIWSKDDSAVFARAGDEMVVLDMTLPFDEIMDNRKIVSLPRDVDSRYSVTMPTESGVRFVDNGTVYEVGGDGVVTTVRTDLPFQDVFLNGNGSLGLQLGYRIIEDRLWQNITVYDVTSGLIEFYLDFQEVENTIISDYKIPEGLLFVETSDRYFILYGIGQEEYDGTQPHHLFALDLHGLEMKYVNQAPGLIHTRFQDNLEVTNGEVKYLSRSSSFDFYLRTINIQSGLMVNHTLLTEFNLKTARLLDATTDHAIVSGSNSNDDYFYMVDLRNTAMTIRPISQAAMVLLPMVSAIVISLLFLQLIGNPWRGMFTVRKTDTEIAHYLFAGAWLFIAHTIMLFLISIYTFSQEATAFLVLLKTATGLLDVAGLSLIVLGLLSKKYRENKFPDITPHLLVIGFLVLFRWILVARYSVAYFAVFEYPVIEPWQQYPRLMHALVILSSGMLSGLALMAYGLDTRARFGPVPLALALLFLLTVILPTEPVELYPLITHLQAIVLLFIAVPFARMSKLT